MRVERKCVRCGKNFIPAPYHLYVHDDQYYCSWTCYNHRNDNQEKPKKESRVVEQYNKDGKLIRKYNTAVYAAECILGTANGIRDACRRSTAYKGYYWKYDT